MNIKSKLKQLLNYLVTIKIDFILLKFSFKVIFKCSTKVKNTSAAQKIQENEKCSIP